MTIKLLRDRRRAMVREDVNVSPAVAEILVRLAIAAVTLYFADRLPA